MTTASLTFRSAVACVTAMLVAPVAIAAAPRRPPKVADQLLAVKITFAGTGTYSQTIAGAACYDDAGKYIQGGTVQRDASFKWTSVYDPIQFTQSQLKLVGPINIGDAKPEDRTVSGTWSRVDPCHTVGGEVTDTEDLGGPSTTGTFVRGKLDGDAVLFEVPAMSMLGDPVRKPLRFLGGHLMPDGRARFGPEFPGIGVTNSLVATVKVPLAQLRALNVGAGGKSVIPLSGPIDPWTFTGFEEPVESVKWAGSITIEPACAPNLPIGPGYDQMTAPMKAALKRLYAQFDRIKACYRFTIGYRDQSYQDALRDRWHGIADKQGAKDDRSYDAVCTAVKAAGFAQCPVGSGQSWRDSHGNAIGGPARVSRHTAGQAADITVLWPPAYERDVTRYQAAARGAGLCGPPATDPVHVELAYVKDSGPHKGTVRCWFPPGPPPGGS